MASISTSTLKEWHNAILLRQPDDAALRFWLSEQDGPSPNPSELIASLLGSAEYAANVLPVMILYQLGLGRIPDLEGLRYWSSALASGQSMASLTETFSQTPEFSDLFGSTMGDPSNTNMISTLFQKTFGREPTNAELSFWSSNGLSQAQILSSFVQSPEALERFTESSQILSAYLAIDGELPTPAQLEVALNAGNITQILSGLLRTEIPLPVSIIKQWRSSTTLRQPEESDGGDPPLEIPTLTLNHDPLISANLTAQSSARGFLLLSDQSIADLEAGIPIALNDLPMLDTLSSAPLVAQSELGQLSLPSSQIVTFGTIGDDLFSAEDESIIQYVFTGPGNDSIYGGASNDYLSGGTDNDAIWGENGNDVIFGGAGADTLDGGDGIDTLNYSDVHSPDIHGIEGITGIAINLTPDQQLLDGFIAGLSSINDAFVQSEWLNTRIIHLQNQRYGSPDDENPNVLDVNSVAYLLSAEGEVSAPRDSVSNFEIIIGSPLDDFIFTVGDYEIDGTHGDDILISQGNQLILRGGQGNDFFFASGNSIELDGGSGDDILISFPPYYDPESEMIPTARITGGAGADQIVLAFGGQNYITLYAEASDLLNLGGLSNSNYLEQDRIVGLSSEDFFELHLGSLREFSPENIRFERMDVESDSPVYLYSVNTNPQADMEAPDISSAGDIQVLITNTLIVESDFDDLSSFWADRTILNLTGTDQNDSLVGGVNNDTISAGGGNDLIAGGSGMDIVNLGNGSNTIVLSAFAQIEPAEGDEGGGVIGWSDSNALAKDSVNGFDGDDFIALNLYNLEDFLFGEDITVNSIEDGYLYAVDTNYLAGDLSGGIADIEIIFANPTGSLDTIDLKERTILNLSGTEFSDNISGGPNNDTIIGDDGDDVIEGNPGDDSLFGDGGNDAINGGSGADYLVGGSGNDIFRYQEDSTGITIETADIIEDFTTADDLISIGIPEYLSTDATFRMEDGSTLSDFTQFVGRADQAFVDGMRVFVAFNVGFLSGDGLSGINHNGDSSLNDGDALIVLVGISAESDISGANFIAEVD